MNLFLLCSHPPPPYIAGTPINGTILIFTIKLLICPNTATECPSN